MKKCLYCYQLLQEGEQDFHSSCCKIFFGEPVVPVLPFSEKDIEKLALEVIRSQFSVTGVQPKLSLDLNPSEQKQAPKRLTIVGLWGKFILKPPTLEYPHLPEVEDLTMHLASLASIKVAPHSLIRLSSGKLAYITKRVDRLKKGKLHMEDLCQLSEKQTEHKYRGSYEQVGKTILKFSANPGLDLVNFLEVVVFSFLTGNADMHLKNFSLIYKPGVGPVFSPAYDLVATALVNPEDDEDVALTLNGKKKKLHYSDFLSAFNTLGLEMKQGENIFRKMLDARPQWETCINDSFLNASYKSAYHELLEKRFSRLALE